MRCYVRRGTPKPSDLDPPSYREAAAAEGYATWSDVWRYANRFGLIDLSTGRLIGGVRRIARLSNDELEKRLIEQPESITSRDLVIANGVALDKLAKRERWGQEPDEGKSYASALDKLAEAIAKSGVRLELKVEPLPAPGDPCNTIDVTPPISGVPAPAKDLRQLAG